MVKKYLISVLFLLSYKLAFSALPSSVIHGAKLFQQYCSACHSVKYLQESNSLPSFPVKDTPAILGVHPPDLSLEVNTHGTKWVYAYLDGFYPDPKSPTGMNNKAYPGTVMPNMLGGLKSQLSPQEFKTTLNDLVSFLAYASEPHKDERKKLGFCAIGFLIILVLTLYLIFFYLKREIVIGE
jgi:ubiquinol-cytochrome c reductase cytochrome c1 subunit